MTFTSCILTGDVYLVLVALSEVGASSVTSRSVVWLIEQRPGCQPSGMVEELTHRIICVYTKQHRATIHTTYPYDAPADALPCAHGSVHIVKVSPLSDNMSANRHDCR